MSLFTLKKIVGYWLMPLPSSLALLTLGALLLRFEWSRKFGRTLVTLGVLWLLLLSNRGVGTFLIRGLEDDYAAVPTLVEGKTPPEVARCEFVVVLGSGHAFVPEWSANNQLVSGGLARLVEGVRILRHLPKAKLIVSGPASPDGGPTHARILANAAVELGIDRARIVEIDTARDTAEEAQAVRALVSGAPVALVTSATHMPRSVGLFKKQGMDVLACPTDFSARDVPLPPGHFLDWDLGGLERSTGAIYETLGRVWTKLRGQS